MLQYHHFAQLDSTNAYLQRKQSECDIRNWVVSTDEQTAGKGMGSNGWESEARQNLTFSIALGMDFLPAERQFLLSEAVPLGIVEVLDGLLSDSFEGIDSNRTASARNDMPSKPAEKLSIKWPNDIYYENHKLAGILINSTIKANMMDISIIGIGLNVNQMRFQDWPTNPISMRQISGKIHDLDTLLKQVAESVTQQVTRLKNDIPGIERDYLKRLYRYRTWADYEVEGETLHLMMTGIDAFGRLQLVDKAEKTYCFDIKEIKFIL